LVQVIVPSRLCHAKKCADSLECNTLQTLARVASLEMKQLQSNIIDKNITYENKSRRQWAMLTAHRFSAVTRIQTWAFSFEYLFFMMKENLLTGANDAVSDEFSCEHYSDESSK
jgi:hypothetical protein